MVFSVDKTAVLHILSAQVLILLSSNRTKANSLVEPKLIPFKKPFLIKMISCN